ncbi:ABC transporter ATP-binding protein [Rhodoferax saidenbachensis]|uniref:Cyclolysin secretion/processing ATP-binding protein CyaB n=1 Tax=Rhodoferax saidenbachensis TaxID=1484693 RepID=A0A1P8KE04_9BURK|nr:ABC transporter ATP-binding protein [Rhodoferax saidenbachensis]APW44196.1 ATPase [Rhodoferax saidenbachensis]
MTTSKKLWQLLSAQQRRSAGVLLGFMLVGMVLETLSVGLIIPAMAMMTQSDLAAKYPFVAPMLRTFGNPTQEQLLVSGLLVLVGIYAVKALFLGFLAWRQSRFAHDLQASLAFRLFAGYLRQPYSFHLQRNSAQLIRNIISSVNGITNVVQQGLILISEALVLVGFSALLLWVEPGGALVVVVALGASAWAFHRFTRKHIERWGKASQLHEGLRIQHLQQGLGGAKDVKLLGREHDFLEQFKVHNRSSTRVAEHRSTLQAFPRLFLELLAVTGLAALVIIMLSQGKQVDALLPTLGLFAAAAFRLMPSINRVMAAVQSVRFSHPVIDTVFSEMKLVDTPPATATGKVLPLKKELRLEDIRFRYPTAECESLHLNALSIPCGASVGFIGGSGAGKSTLIDVLLGLLTPDHGTVRVDGVDIQQDLRGWQNQIGYVPQTIYLTDDTLRRNIAFGLPNEQIDEKAVLQAIQSAQLDEFVDELSQGLDTMVGERGIRLSGGQRQRIGIARALYHSPSVLVLDEATSALDGDTEQAVMEAIDSLSGKLTILIVAHRVPTLKNCTQIVELKSGKIAKIGAYRDIVGAAA